MGCIQDLAHSLKTVAAGGLVALTLTANAVDNRPLTHQELNSIINSFVFNGKRGLAFWHFKFSELLERPVWYQELDIAGGIETDITIFYEIDFSLGDPPISAFFDNGDGQWDTSRGDLYYVQGDDGLYRLKYLNEDVDDA